MKVIAPTFFGLSLSALAVTATASPDPPRRIELGPCATTVGLPADARCGTYEVFENRAAKTGGRFRSAWPCCRLSERTGCPIPFSTSRVVRAMGPSKKAVLPRNRCRSSARGAISCPSPAPRMWPS